MDCFSSGLTITKLHWSLVIHSCRKWDKLQLRLSRSPMGLFNIQGSSAALHHDSWHRSQCPPRPPSHIKLMCHLTWLCWDFRCIVSPHFLSLNATLTPVLDWILHYLLSLDDFRSSRGIAIQSLYRPRSACVSTLCIPPLFRHITNPYPDVFQPVSFHRSITMFSFTHCLVLSGLLISLCVYGAMSTIWKWHTVELPDTSRNSHVHITIFVGRHLHASPIRLQARFSCLIHG
jgi:hypothetical protein